MPDDFSYEDAAPAAPPAGGQLVPQVAPGPDAFAAAPGQAWVPVARGKGVTVEVQQPAPATPPQPQAAPATNDDFSYEDAAPAAPTRPVQAAPPMTLGDPTSQISGFMANLNRGAAIGDELAAGAGVVRDLLGGYARFGTDKPGNPILNNLAMLRDTFNDEMAKQRGYEDAFSVESPHLAALSRGGGMALPAALGGAPAAAEALAGSRLAALAQGAAGGAATGYGYGFLDRGSIPQRVQAANIGAALGGGLGAASGAFSPVVPQMAPQAASAADHAVTGVDPLPAIVGSPSMQRLGQMLKGIPWVGAPLGAAAERTAGQLDNGIQQVGRSLGGAASPLEGGTALQRGANSSVAAMKATNDALYRPINALEENRTNIPVANTQARIADMFAEYPNIPEWLERTAPALANVRRTLQGANGQLTFGELKQMRSDIGQMIDDRLTIGNIDQGRLKQLYGAMSDDMQAGAHALGGQDAVDALRIADQHNSEMRSRVGDVMNTVLQAKSPEDAYQKVVAMAGTGSSRADLTQLARLRYYLPGDAWNEFASGVVQSLGRDGSGGFSPDKFVTAYNKMSPEGRKALFGEAADDLDAFSRVAAQQKAAGRFYNHSNSGSHAIGAMMLLEPVEEAIRHLAGGHVAGAAQSVAVPALTGLAGNAAARLLASPGWGRTMLQAAENPSGAARLIETFAAQNPGVAALARQYGQRLQSGLGQGVAGVSASIPSQQSR